MLTYTYKIILLHQFLAKQHRCTMQNGGCDQLCIPTEASERICGCAVGYVKEDDFHCTPYKNFAIVTQLDIARGYSLTDSSEAMVPIAGPGM